MSKVLTAFVTLADSEQYCPHHTQLSERIGRLLTQTEAEQQSSLYYLYEDMENMANMVDVLLAQVDVLNRRIALHRETSQDFRD